MSDWYPDLDRLELDLNQNAQASPPRTIRVAVDRTCFSSDGRLKLLASLELAQAWFAESGLEDVAFEYETLE
jgi:hypothetical protein